MTLTFQQPTRPEPPLRDRSRRRGRRTRRRFPWSAAVLALGFVLGVAVLLYPTTAAWFTQYQQSQRIDALSETVRDLTAESRHVAIENAVAYNEALVDGTSVVAAGENKPLAEADAESDYGRLLHADDTGLMARLKIPSIAVDLPIYHGTSDDTLAKGVGHLEGTALPIGGPSTHSVLTGHRGLADAELFTNLDKVVVGDTFTIEIFGEVLTYQVIDTKVVEPEQTETLYPQRGVDLVTLVTCTPLGINTHRILVTGERILPTPVRDTDAAGQRPDIPGFPFWALGLGAAILLAGAYVAFSARRQRRAP